MNNATLINQTSGDVEIYTPPDIIGAARMALGGFIELDVASSAKANETVQALRYFTNEDDGLKQPWTAETVWMNHPFHAGWKACDETCRRKTCAKRGFHVYEDIPSNADWVNKLVAAFTESDMERACCITFASTSEEWFRPLMEFPQCFLYPRTNYRRPDGSVYAGVTKGSVVTYLGPDEALFRRAFAGMGKVKV